MSAFDSKRQKLCVNVKKRQRMIVEVERVGDSVCLISESDRDHM